MKKLILTLLLVGGAVHAKKQYRVAVIDTGFNPFMTDEVTKNHTCKDGHFDYSTGKAELGLDVIGHGTSVTELVVKAAETKNFCIMHYKIFGALQTKDDVAKAIRMAVKNGAKAINMSISIFNYYRKDKKAIKYALKKGVKIFNAAGNNGLNLNVHCDVYPACFKIGHKDFFVVGSRNMYGDVARYSNVGRIIDVYELGDYNGNRGTSFAAPVAMGKYIKSLNLDKK